MGLHIRGWRENLQKSIPVEKSSPDDPGSRSDVSRHVLRDVSEDVDSR